MTHRHGATAHIENGWWVVRAVGIGREARVGTLAEVEQAARGLYTRHLRNAAAVFDVTVDVYRSTPAAVVRTRWTSRGLR